MAQKRHDYKMRYTKELFVKISRIALIKNGILDTTYYGESDMHKVMFTYTNKQNNKKRFKQSGDSLNYCLNMIYKKLLAEFNYTDNDIEKLINN